LVNITIVNDVNLDIPVGLFMILSKKLFILDVRKLYRIAI